MTIRYLIAAVSSLLVLAATLWTYPNPISASWVASVCYFVLTLLVLQSYDDGRHTRQLTWCVLAGRLLPEIPFRIAYYQSVADNFYITAFTIASIVMAATYHRYRQGTVLMLSVVIMILLNTMGYDAWRALTAH